MLRTFRSLRRYGKEIILRHKEPSTLMSLLSVRFSQALAKGRAISNLPDTREALLFSLLCKRAAAYNVGATEMEAMLRQQILWSLPIFSPVDQAPVKWELAA
jgi:hypothetical protein